MIAASPGPRTAQDRTPPNGPGRLRGLLPVLPLALIVLVPLLAPTREEGDTTFLLRYTDSIVTHISHGVWSGWGGQFALLQALPVLAVRWAGRTDADAVGVLLTLSFACWAVTVIGSWLALRRRSPAVATAVACVMVASPLPFYARSTFGEMLASTCALALVIFATRAKLAGIVLFAFLTSISKDFAPSFAFLAGAAALLPGFREVPWLTRGLRVAVLAAGCIAGAAVNAAFNLARFGSAMNLTSFQPLFIVHSVRTMASFFLGIWLSPSGGILPFWPALVVLLAAGAYFGLRGSRWHQGATVLVLVLLLGLTGGLSRWYAPLGWVCWGPRLELPWLPAAAYVLAAINAGPLDAPLRSLMNRAWALIPAAGTLLALSLPQFAIAFDRGVVDTFFLPDTVCRQIPYIQSGSYFYHCITYYLWHKQPLLLSPLASPAALRPAVACALAALAALWVSGAATPAPLNSR